MAPLRDATMPTTLSHINNISDGTRARELYKYYRPSAPVNDDASFRSQIDSAPQPTIDDAAQSPDEAETARDLNVNSNITSSKISSPDTALTAFCQLTAWRIGCQRAMISLIDAETQYFIAESTKTVDLVDNSKHAPGDGIWMGCSSVKKAGRLCERTIAVEPTSDLSYPCFVVSDLSKDDRFNTLPFVTGSPFLRFYAGVPLITKRGIPIGSLFVVDDRLGRYLSSENLQFMGAMAKTVMKHLEMVREVEEHRRGMKMSRGLASFVEGRAELVEAEVDAEDSEGTKIAGQFEQETMIPRPKSKDSVTISTISTRGSIRSSVKNTNTLGIPAYPINSDKREEDREEKRTGRQCAEYFDAAKQATNERSPDSLHRSPDQERLPSMDSFGGTSISMSSPQDTLDKLASTSGEEESEEASIRALFSRAANLIREAFEIDGGSVFFDAQTGFSETIPRKTGSTSKSEDDCHTESPCESHVSDYERDSTAGLFSEDEDAQDELPSLFLGDDPDLGVSFTHSSAESNKRVEILGFSTADASSINGDDVPGPQVFTPFGEKSLHTLLRRYPRGKLWNFDTDGSVSSSSEEEIFMPVARDPAQGLRRSRLHGAKAKSDARFLWRHFPGVRQLLFVPLWDAGRTRWLSGCFTWSTEPTRILSKQNELSFLTAFGNSVMAEWARIDTEIADQKKGDFIGSISHELRSPLHGILASAEFLSESATGWEKQLVETVDNCGRTLLDTINHILDFSKINHFETNWRKSKRAKSRLGDPRVKGGADLPMINLFQDIDISIVCEEVIESVFAGHVYQNVTARTFDQVADPRGKISDTRRFITSSEQMMGPEELQHSGVAVILDIKPQNYHFNTQPGALRRLIMNLLGNALKYTSHGHVQIRLDCKDTDDLATHDVNNTGEVVLKSTVTLTVTDTGRGISPEFLRSKLFMPFAQENSLSSGTGLGLSIVRAIVSLLEGEITIDSEVGRGTQVKVSIPLLRKASNGLSSKINSRSILSMEAHPVIQSLRTRVIGHKVALHGFDLDTRDSVLYEQGRLLRASVTNFLVNWYGMQVVPYGKKANLIITNETDPSTIVALGHEAIELHRTHRPSIVVLSSHCSTFDRKISGGDMSCNVGYIAKPIGPFKLAKTLHQVLDGAPTPPSPGLEVPSSLDSTDLSNVFEELSVTSMGGEVLDNARMAADSDNARKAIESPTPNAIAEQHTEFPFPTPVPPSRSHPQQLVTSSPTAPPVLAPTTVESVVYPPPPTILIVDDNQINLRLLHTFLSRCNYPVIDTAQNGLDAVKKYEARPDGYDIVFMDITMPILDGYGATRQIRVLEKTRYKRAQQLSTDYHDGNPKIYFDDPWYTMSRAACIIAFTGRSSIEDQQEAVRCGIDLFMTKPVAFKEVGKICDNWIANRERYEEKMTRSGAEIPQIGFRRESS